MFLFLVFALLLSLSLFLILAIILTRRAFLRHDVVA